MATTQPIEREGERQDVATLWEWARQEGRPWVALCRRDRRDELAQDLTVPILTFYRQCGLPLALWEEADWDLLGKRLSVTARNKEIDRHRVEKRTANTFVEGGEQSIPFREPEPRDDSEFGTEVVAEAMAMLPDESRELLAELSGFGGRPPKKYREVARERGVSKSAVERWRRKHVEKLRDAVQSVLARRWASVHA